MERIRAIDSIGQIVDRNARRRARCCRNIYSNLINGVIIKITCGDLLLDLLSFPLGPLMKVLEALIFAGSALKKTRRQIAHLVAA